MKIDSRLRGLLDKLPATVAYWDSALLNQFGNNAFVEWFGIDPKHMIGRHIVDVIGPRLYALNRTYIDGVLSGHEQTFDRTIVDASGVRRHTQAHYIPDVVDGQVQGFFAFVSDITDLKRMSEELRDAQRIAKLGSWTWDIETNAIHWSDQLYEILGRDPSLPMPTMDERLRHYPQPGGSMLQACVQHAMATGEPYELELPFVREDGTPGWLLTSGQAVRNGEGHIVKLRGTAQDVTRRKQIELDLLASRNHLRDMAAHHEITCEADRKHIARELHDELGQLLTALKLDIAKLRRSGRAQDPTLHATFDDMQALTEQMFQVARSVSTSLRPAALDFGLIPSLEWLAQDFAQRNGIPCTSCFDTSDLPLNEAQATTIFRVAQESLTNVARHAQAKQVDITLTHAAHQLQLRIDDNGQGFDLNAAMAGQSFGLLFMRERVLTLGGHVAIDTAPGQGTRVSIAIPLTRAQQMP